MVKGCWIGSTLKPQPTGARIDSLRERGGLRSRDASSRPTTQIITLLNHYNQGKPSLEQVVERGYFSALSLFSTLSRRLLGLKAYETDIKKRHAEGERVRNVATIFEHLAATDSAGYEPPESYRANERVTFKMLHTRKKAYEKKEGRARVEAKQRYQRAVEHLSYKLGLLRARALNDGDGTQNPALHKACKRWIEDAVPDIETRLEMLRTQLEGSGEEADKKYLKAVGVDTLETLAHLLELTLNAVLLDRYLRRVFYGWHERPKDVVVEENPNEGVPRTLLNILPTPLTGRRFGIYHSATPHQGDKSRTLSTLGYTNIGRHYVTNFHQLRSALEGRPGPNVLAMSGTSYLPDSTRWHFSVKPKGVLSPSRESVRAMQRSDCWFRFMPMFQDGPIHVSGKASKSKRREALRQVAARLVGDDSQGGQLAAELGHLRELAVKDRGAWEDRDRLLLLVNSYEQSSAVAKELKSRWQDVSIFHLARKDEEGYAPQEDYEAERVGADKKGGTLPRVDIEQFAETGGEVLVAPLQAIGRGFNILNSQSKAAFGAIYFLTRPMPHPTTPPLPRKNSTAEATTGLRTKRSRCGSVTAFTK